MQYIYRKILLWYYFFPVGKLIPIADNQLMVYTQKAEYERTVSEHLSSLQAAIFVVIVASLTSDGFDFVLFITNKYGRFQLPSLTMMCVFRFVQLFSLVISSPYFLPQ